MGICKIQRPAGINNNVNHGKLYARITCNDILCEEYKYDGTKGDLHLNLVCEEEEGYAFYIGDDTKEAIEKLNKKIDTLQEQLNKLTDIEVNIDLSEFSNYINNHPINIGE